MPPIFQYYSWELGEMRLLGYSAVLLFVECTLQQMTHVRYWASVRLRLSHRIGDMKYVLRMYGTAPTITVCTYIRNIVLHSTSCT